eukprot:1178340-Prorocentrum_minimum.AAC.4
MQPLPGLLRLNEGHRVDAHLDQAYTRSVGIFSRRTNQTQEAWVYSHDGPIRHRKRGYILTACATHSQHSEGHDYVTINLTALLSALLSPFFPPYWPARKGYGGRLHIWSFLPSPCGWPLQEGDGADVVRCRLHIRLFGYTFGYFYLLRAGGPLQESACRKVTVQTCGHDMLVGYTFGYSLLCSFTFSVWVAPCRKVTVQTRGYDTLVGYTFGYSAAHSVIRLHIRLFGYTFGYSLACSYLLRAGGPL